MEDSLYRPIKFIHAADTHLGAPFAGVRLRDSSFGEKLSEAVYRAFDSVIDHAIFNKVDFVLFAGDVFHAERGNLKAQAYFVKGMERLEEKGIRAFVVGGNHDPVNKKRLGLPKNVHLFSAEKVEAIHVDTGEDGREAYSIYGRSYANKEEPSNFVQSFVRQESQNAIGLLHTQVGSASQTGVYAPSTIEDLRAANMDYWALGHVHFEQFVSANNPVAVYPGSTQALNINETGRHGCYLVEMSQGHPTSLEWLSTGQIEFSQARIDISDHEDLESLIDACSKELQEAYPQARDKHLVLRVIFEGSKSFSDLINDDEFVSALETKLSGPLPMLRLDAKVIDETTPDQSGAMAEETNTFLRLILDASNEDLELSIKEMLEQSKLAPAKQNEYLERFENEREQLLREAQTLIFQQLRGDK